MAAPRFRCSSFNRKNKNLQNQKQKINACFDFWRLEIGSSGWFEPWVETDKLCYATTSSKKKNIRVAGRMESKNSKWPGQARQKAKPDLSSLSRTEKKLTNPEDSRKTANGRMQPVRDSRKQNEVYQNRQKIFIYYDDDDFEQQIILFYETNSHTTNSRPLSRVRRITIWNIGFVLTGDLSFQCSASLDEEKW